ncbi:unnamed protein product [Mytilus edulis]|uniref:Chitin-binding type-2 domain-containing protein n=1 Tax=Mytilus edulis TaxID=6550 RepID=A0A8S3PW63_MYTED|nr:unnamed protein product [Mytilus edulis]
MFLNPSVAKLDSSYCKHIAKNGVVTSDDCATSVDCRGTARVYSCRHRNDLQLSGSSCVMTTSYECLRKLQRRQQACSKRKSGLLPDSKFCHLYYDCSNPAKSKICQYPKLFSTKTNTCRDFRKVKCGFRIEFKSYCQYHSHPGAGNRGPPCELQHPNCEGYPDGANPHTEKTGAGSPWYMLCKGERFVKDGICPNARYGFNKKTCQGVGDISGVTMVDNLDTTVLSVLCLITDVRVASMSTMFVNLAERNHVDIIAKKKQDDNFIRLC